MRLDVYLSTQGLCDSRARAQDAIQEGRVTVNGRIAKKSSMPVDDSMDIKLEEAETAFASRAGYKLYDVLKPFEIDLEGRVVLDVVLAPEASAMSVCKTKHALSTQWMSERISCSSD